MDHYVVTGFDEPYWNYWGESWIISLIELAKFDGNILIVDLGLSTSIKKKLTDFGAYFLPGETECQNKRASILRSVTDFSIKYPGIYAVWDADVYFQKSVDEVFDLARDQIVITENTGFYAGQDKDLVWLRETQEMISSLYGEVFVCDFLKQSFPQKVSILDDTWNFTNVTSELDNQNVIHPTGRIKSLLTGKNILFWERHHELYEKHSVVKHMNRKLVKKTDVAIQPE